MAASILNFNEAQANAVMERELQAGYTVEAGVYTPPKVNYTNLYIAALALIAAIILAIIIFF
jgi:hypothetical protein